MKYIVIEIKTDAALEARTEKSTFERKRMNKFLAGYRSEVHERFVCQVRVGIWRLRTIPTKRLACKSTNNGNCFKFSLDRPFCCFSTIYYQLLLLLLFYSVIVPSVFKRQINEPNKNVFLNAFYVALFDKLTKLKHAVARSNLCICSSVFDLVPKVTPATFKTSCVEHRQLKIYFVKSNEKLLVIIYLDTDRKIGS